MRGNPPDLTSLMPTREVRKVALKKGAVLVDLESVFSSLHSVHRRVDWTGLKRMLQDEGYTLTISKVYGDFRFEQYAEETFQRELFNLGFEMVQCPAVVVSAGKRKSRVDQAVIDRIYKLGQAISEVEALLNSLPKESHINIREAVFSIMPGTLFLATGDSDYIRAVQTAQNAGLKVVLLSTGYQVSKDLTDAVDKVLVIPSYEVSAESPETPEPEAEASVTDFSGLDIVKVASIIFTVPKSRSEFGEMLANIGETNKPVHDALRLVLSATETITETSRRTGGRAALPHIRNVINGDYIDKLQPKGWRAEVELVVIEILKVLAASGALHKIDTTKGISYVVNYAHPSFGFLSKESEDSEND